MRSMVTPWSDNLVLSDAFRGPLAESFKLVEIIRNYQLDNKYLKKILDIVYTFVTKNMFYSLEFL